MEQKTSQYILYGALGILIAVAFSVIGYRLGLSQSEQVIMKNNASLQSSEEVLERAVEDNDQQEHESRDEEKTSLPKMSEDAIEQVLQENISDTEFSELYSEGIYGRKIVQTEHVVLLPDGKTRYILCHEVGVGCPILPYVIDQEVGTNAYTVFEMDESIHQLLYRPMALVYSPDETKVAVVNKEITSNNTIGQSTKIVDLTDFSVQIHEEAKVDKLLAYACEIYFPKSDYPKDRIYWDGETLVTKYFSIRQAMYDFEEYERQCLVLYLTGELYDVETGWKLIAEDPSDGCENPLWVGKASVRSWGRIEQQYGYSEGLTLYISPEDEEKLPINFREESNKYYLHGLSEQLKENLLQADESNPISIAIDGFGLGCEGYPVVFLKK